MTKNEKAFKDFYGKNCSIYGMALEILLNRKSKEMFQQLLKKAFMAGIKHQKN